MRKPGLFCGKGAFFPRMWEPVRHHHSCRRELSWRKRFWRLSGADGYLLWQRRAGLGRDTGNAAQDPEDRVATHFTTDFPGWHGEMVI